MATTETAPQKSTIVRIFTPRRPTSAPTWPLDHAFTVRSGDDLLRAWSWGEGPVVLLVHGWEGHAGHMSAFVAPLVSQGFRVVALDLPAHGQSTGQEATVLDLADGLCAVADAVGPVHAVIAHSMGASATALALRPGPRRKGPGWRRLNAGRLVLLAPAESPTQFVYEAVAQFGHSPERTAAILRRIQDRVGVDFAELAISSFAPGLTVPLLLMHDPADRVVPWEHSQAIAAAWPGARLLSIANVGHRRILSDPQVIAEAVSFVSDSLK